MSQGSALPPQKYLTRRSALRLALGGLAIPLQGRAALADVIRIAIPDLAVSFDDPGHLAHLVPELVLADLRGSGGFAPMPWDTLVKTDTGSAATFNVPQFDVWRRAGAQALVTGSLAPAGEKLRFGFRLWDISTGKQLSGREYVAGADDWRQIAHATAGQVYERLTGQTRDFG